MGEEVKGFGVLWGSGANLLLVSIVTICLRVYGCGFAAWGFVNGDHPTVNF